MRTTMIFSPFELRSYIEFLRKDLIDTGLRLGFNHEETITASQELDYFLFQYQTLTDSKLYS